MTNGTEPLDIEQRLARLGLTGEVVDIRMPDGPLQAMHARVDAEVWIFVDDRVAPAERVLLIAGELGQLERSLAQWDIDALWMAVQRHEERLGRLDAGRVK